MLIDPAGLARRMKPGAEQDLVRVDVPDAGNHLLVHEEGLDAPAPSMHEVAKLVPRNGQGIAAEPARYELLKTRTVQQVQAPEAARIPIAEIRGLPAIQREDAMRVFLIAWGKRTEQQQAGHAQLGDEIARLAVALAGQGHAFPISLDSGDARAAIPRQRVNALPDNILAAHPALFHGGTKNTLPQLPGDDFRFRQLRHLTLVYLVYLVCLVYLVYLVSGQTEQTR